MSTGENLPCPAYDSRRSCPHIEFCLRRVVRMAGGHYPLESLGLSGTNYSTGVTAAAEASPCYEEVQEMLVGGKTDWRSSEEAHEAELLANELGDVRIKLESGGG